MRPPLLTEDEIFEIGREIRLREGALPIRRLLKEIGGGYKRISFIVQRINEDVSGRPVIEDNHTDSRPNTPPAPIRDALSRMQETVVDQIRRAVEEEKARGRDTTESLQRAHAEARAAFEEDRKRLEEYLDEVDDIRAELEVERDQARATVSDLSTRVAELELLIEKERMQHVAERDDLARSARAAQEGERRHGDARRDAEIECARAHAELKAVSERLAPALEAQRSLAEELGRTVAERDALAVEMESLRARAEQASSLERELVGSRNELAEAQGRIATLGAMQDRLEQMVAGALESIAAPPGQRPRRGKDPASTKRTE